MNETDQMNLDNKKVPDVSMEEETKYFSVYRSKHLKIIVEKDAMDKLNVKLDKLIEKGKLHSTDKDKHIKAWVQSKARMTGAKNPLTDGQWDKETKQLCDEIMGE